MSFDEEIKNITKRLDIAESKIRQLEKSAADTPKATKTIVDSAIAQVLKKLAPRNR